MILNKSIKKIIIPCVICATLFLGCSGEKQLSSYEQGIASLENENFQQALNYFKEAEGDGSNMQLVYRGEGMAYLGLGKYGESLEAFNNALAQSNGLLKKVDYDINFYMAVAEYKSGNPEAAVATYTNILAIDKNNSDAYYLRGKVSLDLSNLDGAKSDFAAAIEKDKNNSKLYINIYEDLKDHGYENEAKTYINQALANVAKPSKYDLGVFNYYLGDYTQARNYFEESSDCKKTAEGIIYLGKTYEALNDAEYAAALYEEFTNNNKTADIVYNELGLLKANKKDYEGALSAFEAGLASETTTCRQTLMYNSIVANEFLGNFKNAAKLCKEYLELYPDDKIADREFIFLSTR